MLQRYFTPHSAAMAEYALANAVINRLKHQKSTADEPRLSPIASLSSKEGALQRPHLQPSCRAHMTSLQEQVSCLGATTCSTSPTRLESAQPSEPGLRSHWRMHWPSARNAGHVEVCHCTAARMTPASHAGEEAQIIMEEVANLLHWPCAHNASHRIVCRCIERHMTPAARAGEEAQIIMEEVAALLRNSASSAGGLGAEQMRRLDSARSSLMSDLEAAQSLGSERAGSAEGLDPAFLARLEQAPPAPMPLKGGGILYRPPHWSDHAWVSSWPVPSMAYPWAVTGQPLWGCVTGRWHPWAHGTVARPPLAPTREEGYTCVHCTGLCQRCIYAV